MPYALGIPYRDGEPVVYDSGDYPAALAKALDALGGLDAFRRRQARGAQRRAGISGSAWAAIPKAPGWARSKAPRCASTARERSVCSPARPTGAGMETVFAQIAADAWSVTPTTSRRAGRQRRDPDGLRHARQPLHGERLGAIRHASERLREKAFAIAGNLLECAAADLELRKGAVGVAGVPGAAGLARPAGAGVASRLGPPPPERRRRRPGRDPLLRAANRHLGLRHPCGHRRGRHRDRTRENRALRGRARLWRAW